MTSQKKERPCNPKSYVIDTYCDHIHTCRQHTGSTRDAHETILDALLQICHESGLMRSGPRSRGPLRDGHGNGGTAGDNLPWS